jgi:hypothetical protein
LVRERWVMRVEDTVPRNKAGRLLAVGVPILGTVALLAPFLHEVVFSGDHGLTVHASARGTNAPDQNAADSVLASITVDYPQDASIFPPDIIAPTFLWRDAEPSARSWCIDVSFADHAKKLRIISAGEGLKLGEIDPRCVSTANKPPVFCLPAIAKPQNCRTRASAAPVTRRVCSFTLPLA